MGDNLEPIELANEATGGLPTADRRPRMPEPLPVRLVVIDDVHLTSPAGNEELLNEFFVDLLGFERNADDAKIIYRADNARIFFEVVEVPACRVNYRPIQIEVPSLIEMEMKLVGAEIEFTRQKGLSPGQDSLLLLDPAGNWMEILEARVVW
jgi:hypothetical protein